MLIRSTCLIEQLTTKQPASRTLLNGPISTAAVAAFSKQELAEFRRRLPESATLPRPKQVALRRG